MSECGEGFFVAAEVCPLAHPGAAHQAGSLEHGHLLGGGGLGHSSPGLDVFEADTYFFGGPILRGEAAGFPEPTQDGQPGRVTERFENRYQLLIGSVSHRTTLSQHRDLVIYLHR